MPVYFYHLKFELYTSSRTKVVATAAGTSSSQHGGSTAEGDDTWLPPTNLDIFSQLPAHPQRKRRKSTQITVPENIPVYDLISKLPTAPHREQVQPSSLSLIDCGPSRGATYNDSKDSNLFTLLKRQIPDCTKSSPAPSCLAGIGPHLAAKDWRFSQLSIESFDAVRQLPHNLTEESIMNSDSDALAGRRPAPDVGPNMGQLGTRTMAQLVPLNVKNTEVGWGVVHLYREGDTTPELDRGECGDDDELDETQYTTLCIPAVPSSPGAAGFLNFIGPEWIAHVAHWRLVMTSDWSSYLVLIKFRDGKKAKLFRDQHNGRVFYELGPGTCHVLYVRSITFETENRPLGSTFPDLTHDPFVPPSLKPFPPPTPSLTELPTCPVCLERMDDTTGLVTIPCQHVFHCTCLKNWQGSGCPVCRYTNHSISAAGPSSPDEAVNPYAQPFGRNAYNLCAICDSPDDLWVCLICGHVGCGRYKGAHAKDHWKETAHSFSLELETQHVWDYAGDMWVHRLIRDKGDGKVMELPDRSNGGNDRENRMTEDGSVPRSKLQSIGMEYTHLLSSQLESQRVYFEEMLNKTVDKASLASAAAERATEEAAEARKETRMLREDHEKLVNEGIPQLERDLVRERKRADKASELARNLGKSLQEEKKVSEGLMERITHTNKELEAVRQEMGKLKMEKVELEDMNRDLSLFISGQQKLKEMEDNGQVGEDEVREGTASAPQREEISGSGGGGRRKRRGGNRGCGG